MEKILIITYYWPPSGGPGVQRWLKFVKYLPSFGFDPIVLTVDPAYATYPVCDPLLEKDVPSTTEVIRTPTNEPFTLYKKFFRKAQVPYSGFANERRVGLKNFLARFIRGNFFVPDARVGWNKYALRKAIELIDRHDLKAIITTSPPHSSQLIGLNIKKKRPYIRWIADLRDPWTDIYYYGKMLRLPIIRKIDAWFEKLVLSRADLSITVSQNLADHFKKKIYPKSIEVAVISNGFDPVDFLKQDTRNNSEFKSLITIGYTGTISDDYDLSGFLCALNNVAKKGEVIYNLCFTGSVSQRWVSEMEKLHNNVKRVIRGHVPHPEAINQMQNSDLLLLLIPATKNNKGIVTGKIFEYIASCRPVLGIGPADGDAALILSETGSGKMFEYNDVSGISDYLLSGSILSYKPEYDKIEKFNRAFLTRQLAKLIRGN